MCVCNHMSKINLNLESPSPPAPSRQIMIQWRQKVPKRASLLHIWCQPTPCTACSRRRPTWAPGPSPSLTCRATQDTPPATRCRRHSANRRCCPALVPLPLPPSRSARRSTLTSSSPCIRAHSSTNQLECSRSSPSQSSLTRWGCRPLFTPRLPGSR